MDNLVKKEIPKVNPIVSVLLYINYFIAEWSAIIGIIWLFGLWFRSWLFLFLFGGGAIFSIFIDFLFLMLFYDSIKKSVAEKKYSFIKLYIKVFFFNFLITRVINFIFDFIYFHYYLPNRHHYSLAPFLLIAYSMAIIPLQMSLMHHEENKTLPEDYLLFSILQMSSFYAEFYVLFLIFAKYSYSSIFIFYISLILFTYFQTNKIKNDLIKLFNQNE
jgi:hypothetical protein